MKKRTKIVKKDQLTFNVIGYVFISILAIFCLIPFIMIISASFTDEKTILAQGYSILPAKFSLQAYKTIFSSSGDIIRSYGVTIFITITGVGLGLFITSMTAYVLYRKDFKYRNVVSFLIFFTQIFGGGLIPWYIMCVKVFHLKNSILALILPMLLTPFYIILMRNFMKSLPDSVIESAKIDGAGDFGIFMKICLPLSKPGLATIGLFMALEYWNAWMPAMLFIENTKLYPLQYFLYQILTQINFANQVTASSGIPLPDLPKESLKMAMAVVVTGPIVLGYPYVQKYFVKGLTVGAVKG